MTIEQLRCFLMVAKNLSFSQSAEELYLSQSSLSKNIKSLEEELAVKLFDRNTRMIRLTDAGRFLHLHATTIVEEYEKMRTGIVAFNPERSQSLSIMALPIIAQYGIANMIAGFTEGNPNIDINLSESDAKHVINALDMKEIDIGVVRRQHVEKQGRYKIYPLVDDELVLVTSAKHRFAEQSSIDLAEAANERFVLLNEDTYMYKTCVKICEEAGFFPKHRRPGMGLATIRSFVKQGLGVALLMKRTVTGTPDPDLHILHLNQKLILTISLVTRNEPLTPACQDFIQFAGEYFL